MSFDWKSLQNGSDIRGVAVDGIESEPITLSQEGDTVNRVFIVTASDATIPKDSEN